LFFQLARDPQQTPEAFNDANVAYTVSLTAIDSGGARVVEDMQMRFRYKDEEVAAYGPNKQSCFNDGDAMDAIPFDGEFSCDCEMEFAGDNCAAVAVSTVTAADSGVIVGSVLGAIILIIVGLLAGFKYRQHRIAMQPADFASIFNQMVESGEISIEQIQSIADKHGKLPGRSRAGPNMRLPREIPRRCITKSEKVGEGAFGEVFKGILDETSNNGVPGYMVACKSVTDSAGDGADDLLQEATVMAQIGTHVNLVSLIGVVTSGVPLLIIIALCENGSLKSQLEKRVLGEGKLAAEPGALPPKIDADIGMEIARGMQHLVEHHLVHRDLAARNVLLDSQLIAKVADFGLSRAFSNEGGEYYKSTNGMMALRWTAPEAMSTLKFSMKTDVWAFGIVLLEIAINGELPIKELTNAEIMAQMQSGYKTPKPGGCSADMYNVMCQCWSLDPSARPSFLDLVDILSDLCEDDFANNDQSLYTDQNGGDRSGGSGGGGAGGGLAGGNSAVASTNDYTSYTAPGTNGASVARSGGAGGEMLVNDYPCVAQHGSGGVSGTTPSTDAMITAGEYLITGNPTNSRASAALYVANPTFVAPQPSAAASIPSAAASIPLLALAPGTAEAALGGRHVTEESEARVVVEDFC
jgi:serine/threonine protein kinase